MPSSVNGRIYLQTKLVVKGLETKAKSVVCSYFAEEIVPFKAKTCDFEEQKWFLRILDMK